MQASFAYQRVCYCADHWRWHLCNTISVSRSTVGMETEEPIPLAITARPLLCLRVIMIKFCLWFLNTRDILEEQVFQWEGTLFTKNLENLSEVDLFFLNVCFENFHAQISMSALFLEMFQIKFGASMFLWKFSLLIPGVSSFDGLWCQDYWS